MNPEVKIAVSLLIATKKTNGVVFAKCPFLNVVTQGENEEVALKNLEEEIQFFLETCCAEGTLAAVLDERTKKRREPFSPDDFVQVEPRYYTVPSDIPPEVLKLMADAAVSVP